MPVITFFQTKGGTGKTTSAFALAEILARGKPTTVIDSDRRKPFSKWLNRGGEGHGFEIVQETDEKKIVPVIHDAANKSTFVIVDTEGSGNTTSAKAVAVSDLVIVTTTCSALDQDGVSEALTFVKDLEKKTGRKIPAHVLITRQKIVGVPKAKKIAEQQMRDAGLNVFKIKVTERSAFEAIFGYSMTLFNLDPKQVNEPEKGYFNAKALSIEVLKALQAARQPKEKPAESTSKPAKAKKQEAA